MNTSTPRALRVGHVREEGVRRAVRGEHAHLVRDAELGQGVARRLHDVEIALAAHEDRDQRLRHGRIKPQGRAGRLGIPLSWLGGTSSRLKDAS